MVTLVILYYLKGIILFDRGYSCITSVQHDLTHIKYDLDKVIGDCAKRETASASMWSYKHGRHTSPFLHKHVTRSDGSPAGPASLH